MQKASRCETYLSCAPDFITGCFLLKSWKLMPFLCKNAFLYLSGCYYTSELNEHLEGTGSLVETFHSSVDSFLEQEASTQRSWHLGTAASGSSGSVTASGGLRSGLSHWASKSKSLCVCYFMNSSLTASSLWLIFTHSRKHFQDPGMARQMVLKEWFGSSLHPKVKQ